MPREMPRHPPIQSDQEAQDVAESLAKSYELWPDAGKRPDIVRMDIENEESRLVEWTNREGAHDHGKPERAEQPDD